jgi:hypothetical protein
MRVARDLVRVDQQALAALQPVARVQLVVDVARALLLVEVALAVVADVVDDRAGLRQVLDALEQPLAPGHARQHRARVRVLALHPGLDLGIGRVLEPAVRVGDRLAEVGVRDGAHRRDRRRDGHPRRDERGEARRRRDDRVGAAREAGAEQRRRRELRKRGAKRRACGHAIPRGDPAIVARPARGCAAHVSPNSLRPLVEVILTRSASGMPASRNWLTTCRRELGQQVAGCGKSVDQYRQSGPKYS